MRAAAFYFLTITAALQPAARADAAKDLDAGKITFRELHKKHRTELLTRPAPPKPPQGELELISYKSPAGQLAAYISPNPGDGKKHPLIIWLIGGFSNSISEYMWEKADPSNDQSAVQYRRAGLATMYPSLRGGNNNPGQREGYFGEVDDVIAAAEHAAKLPWVDSSRIYLGGHSTGGTLALLVAANSDLFRAVISIEPVHTVLAYGEENLPFNAGNRDEIVVRAPVAGLPEIKSATLVLGGDEGNVRPFEVLQKNCKNPKVQFISVPGGNHFNFLLPFNEMLAKKILADTGKECALAISKEEAKAGAARIVKPKKEKEAAAEDGKDDEEKKGKGK